MAVTGKVWAIGDLQGCLDPLRALLKQVAFNPAQDKLIFCGDLINRGPQSLASLRFVKQLGAAATTVLGNHDLHFLAVAAGVRKLSRSDTLQEILDAPDASELVNWLRQQPLAIASGRFVITHAGVPPQWTPDDLFANARKCERKLAGAQWQLFLATAFGNQPDLWANANSAQERRRYTVNALTRLRFIHADGRLDFLTKEGTAPASARLTPWFDAPQRAWRKQQDPTLIFGHWSTLGVFERENLVSLDGGCVWGGCLAAYLLDDTNPRIERVECKTSV